MPNDWAGGWRGEWDVSWFGSDEPDFSYLSVSGTSSASLAAETITRPSETNGSSFVLRRRQIAAKAPIKPKIPAFVEPIFVDAVLHVWTESTFAGQASSIIAGQLSSVSKAVAEFNASAVWQGAMRGSGTGHLIAVAGASHRFAAAIAEDEFWLLAA